MLHTDSDRRASSHAHRFPATRTLAEDLVLLAIDVKRNRLIAPALDELLAAADLADLVLAGEPLPDDLYRAVRDRAGSTRGRRSDRTLHAMICSGRLRMERRRHFGVPVQHVQVTDETTRAALLEALESGLKTPSRLPLRLGLLAALASAGGLQVAADDLASGVVQLVSDPDGAVPALADALRRALDALG